MPEVSPEAVSSQVQCQVPLNTVDYISLYLMVDADRIGEKLNPAEISAPGSTSENAMKLALADLRSVKLAVLVLEASNT